MKLACGYCWMTPTLRSSPLAEPLPNEYLTTNNPG
jgi:hypothetical protein